MNTRPHCITAATSCAGVAQSAAHKRRTQAPHTDTTHRHHTQTPHKKNTCAKSLKSESTSEDGWAHPHLKKTYYCQKYCPYNYCTIYCTMSPQPSPPPESPRWGWEQSPPPGWGRSPPPILNGRNRSSTPQQDGHYVVTRITGRHLVEGIAHY